MVIGVEQVLGTLTERLFEVLLIAADHIRILVAEAESTGCILCIQCLRTLRCHLDAVVDRLSAATDTAARAGHDFDEIILDGLLRSASRSFAALPRPFTTATRTGMPLMSKLASFQPS